MKYITGDLLDVTEGIICHGCNLSGGFGSGVAGAIARMYPSVRENYHANYRDKFLGDISGLEVIDGLYILNCYTQQGYGRDKNVQYASYDAVRDSMVKVIDMANTLGIKQVHIPRIGAGLGGLNWEIVENVLRNLEIHYGMEFVVHSL